MDSSRIVVTLLILVTLFLAAQVTMAAKPQQIVTGVIDATGKAVGKLVGTFRYGSSSGNPADVPLVYADVSLEVNGIKFVVSVAKNQFYGNSELWFAGPDCTGQAYFEGHAVNNAPRLFPAIGIPPVGSVAYISHPNANMTAVQVSSQSRFRSGHLSTYCLPNITTLTDAIEATSLGNLATLYTPPFSFQFTP